MFDLELGESDPNSRSDALFISNTRPASSTTSSAQGKDVIRFLVKSRLLSNSDSSIMRYGPIRSACIQMAFLFANNFDDSIPTVPENAVN